MPWLINEDGALKRKLQGLKVHDINEPTGGRPVAVRFRFPEMEIGTISYPMIVIEHGTISKADDREHQGPARTIPYSPEGYPPLVGDSKLWINRWPIPYNIDYVVTTYTRKALHDRALTAELSVDSKLPSRYGYLEIPEDGTIRRLDLIGGPEPADTMDPDGKRIFRKTYMVRVSSELLPEQIYQITNPASVLINLKRYSDSYDFPAGG